MKAFLVMGRSLKALYDDLFLYVWISALWWVGTVLVLTAAPVTSSLNRIANRVANYKRVDTSMFYEGIRMRLGQSWLVFGGSLAIVIVLIFNIIFYLNQNTGWMRVFGFAWIWLLLIFLLMSQYFFPLFWQQEEPKVLLILRNSFVLAMQNPLYTILMLIFQILLAAVCIVTVLPILLLLPAAIAVTSNHAMVGILQEMDLAPKPPSGNG